MPEKPGQYPPNIARTPMTRQNIRLAYGDRLEKVSNWPEILCSRFSSRFQPFFQRSSWDLIAWAFPKLPHILATFSFQISQSLEAKNPGNLLCSARRRRFNHRYRDDSFHQLWLYSAGDLPRKSLGTTAPGFVQWPEARCDKDFRSRTTYCNYLSSTWQIILTEAFPKKNMYTFAASKILWMSHLSFLSTESFVSSSLKIYSAHEWELLVEYRTIVLWCWWERLAWGSFDFSVRVNRYNAARLCNARRR